MPQELINVLQIFILPVFAGVLIRLVFKRFSRAWIVSIVFAVLAAAWFVVALFPPVSGNEMYILVCLQNVLAAAGSAVTELFLFLIKKKKTD